MGTETDSHRLLVMHAGVQVAAGAMTPLLAAARNPFEGPSVELLVKLLAAGADPAAVNDEGKTAIWDEAISQFSPLE